MAFFFDFGGLGLVLLVGLAMQFVQGVSPGPTPVATGTMMLAFAGVGCGTCAAFKRDPYRATRFGIVASVLVLILGIAIVVSVDNAQVISIGVIVGALSTALALVGHLVRANRGSDTIPNLLLARTGPSEIRESNDVQWFVTQSTRHLESAATVDITFQNCVDTARTVRVRLLDRRAQHGSKKVVFPEVVGAELSPSEVARVTLPIRALPRASGTVEIELRIDVSGTSGQRTRRFRAKQARSSAKGWLGSTTLLKDSRLKWNTDSLFKFELRARASMIPSSPPALNERWERLWTVSGRASKRPLSLDVGNADSSIQRQQSFNSNRPLLQHSSHPATPRADSTVPRSLSALERSVSSPSESQTPRSLDSSARRMPASSAPPWSGSIPAQPLLPGIQVRVHRGNSVRPAKIVEVDQMRVRCEFDDGQQAWVMPTQLDV